MRAMLQPDFEIAPLCFNCFRNRGEAHSRASLSAWLPPWAQRACEANGSGFRRHLQLKQNKARTETRDTRTTHRRALSPGGMTPGKLNRIAPMNALALMIKQALVVLRPNTDVPKAANDNVDRAVFQAYIRGCHAHAALDYQPAASKMWWLP
jgi:hypothetical protein